MSRIGKKAIPIPDGVDIDLQFPHVRVKGPKGTLERDLHPLIQVERIEGQLLVTRNGDTKEERSLHGLTRALLQNMVVGVSEGFKKVLELTGVGYKAAVQGNALILQIGYTHPVELPFPPGVNATVEVSSTTAGSLSRISVSGVDRQAVGAFADRVRKVRRPDPYKGKGVKYAGEILRRKAGKALGKGAVK
jgi:large subunit ribosomal protein L6